MSARQAGRHAGPPRWREAIRHVGDDLPARAAEGRPARIAARAVLAAGAAIAAALIIPGTPASDAITAAAPLWWVLSSYPELAPPRGR